MSKSTSDGISGEKWEKVHELSVSYANNTRSGKKAAAESIRRRLIRTLNRLQSTYGARPSILATKAEYAKRSGDRERLLLEAFKNAKHRKDAKNLTLIASSLAEYYADEDPKPDELTKWISHLKDALKNYYDDGEAAVLKELKGRKF